MCVSIEVVLDGVYDDYHRRSAYIAYLVQSHQKFHDAKMQVAAVQEAINRLVIEGAGTGCGGGNG